MADFLTQNDLIARSSAAVVLRLADDDGDGALGAADLSYLDTIMEEAEGLAYTSLLRAFPAKATIIDLVNADPFLKGQVAWVALELLTERKPELCGPEGWGAYRAQYERAIKHFDMMGKGRQRSAGEASVATNAHVGGLVQPTPPAGGGSQFLFAPSRHKPGGGGGF